MTGNDFHAGIAGPQESARQIPVNVPASWVIREKATGKVLLETFEKRTVDTLNTAKYEAIPILDYLVSLNHELKTDILSSAHKSTSSIP